MSETHVSIMCKVDKRSKAKIKSIEQQVQDFCANIEHDDCSQYYEKKYLVHNLAYYKGDIEEVFELLKKLEPYSQTAPIAKHDSTRTGLITFFSLINNKVVEFENLSEAHDALQQAESQTQPGIKTLPYIQHKTSLIRLNVKKAKVEKVQTLFASLVDSNYSTQELHELIKGFYPKTHKFKSDYILNTDDKEWNGQLERICSHIAFVVREGNRLTLGLNLYDEDLFPEHITQDEYDLGCKIEDAIEFVLYELFEMKCFGEIAIRFRQQAIRNSNIMRAEGGSGEIYYAFFEMLYDDSDWLS